MMRTSLVSDQLEFNPSGLTPSQFKQLSQYVDRAAALATEKLLGDARQHLEQTQISHETNCMTNVW